MLKKLLLISAFLFISLGCVDAAGVGETAAQTIALNFFNITYPHAGHHGTASAVLKYTQTEPDSTADFYVFDIHPLNGFVIVSARDEVKPVLAYSNESY